MLGNINCSVLNYKKIGVKVELQSIWMLKNEREQAVLGFKRHADFKLPLTELKQLDSQ